MTLTVLSLVLATLSASAAAACELQFRIWTADGGNVFYDYGDPVVVESGVESHLYIHHDARGPNPYSTSGEISHLSALGMGRHIDTRKHLVWKEQDGADKADAKLELSPKEPGEVTLGYRLTGVDNRGAFESLPARCREGRVTIRVVDAPSAAKPPAPEVGSGDSWRAAEDVVRVLESALLGRTNSTPQRAHVEQVAEQGHRGAVFVAMELVGGPEFANHVYRSTADKQPGDRRGQRYGDVSSRVTGRQSIEQALQQMYLDLYGSSGSVQLDVHQQNVAEMFECLRGGATTESREGACRRLGRALVKTAAFAEQHEILIAQLPESYRGALD